MSEPSIFDEGPAKTPEEARKRVRFGGVMICVGGALMAAIFLGWPTYQALSGAESITIYSKLCYGGIAAFYWGLLMAIFGDIPIPKRGAALEPRHWAFIILGVALVLTSSYYADRHFKSLGYAKESAR